MATWEDVRRLALELPQTEAGTTFGNLAWKISGKGFIWERPLRRSDVEAIFTTPHFNGYPAILVELQKIGVDELRELIEEAWLACAPKRVAKAYLDSR